MKTVLPPTFRKRCANSRHDKDQDKNKHKNRRGVLSLFYLFSSCALSFRRLALVLARFGLLELLFIYLFIYFFLFIFIYFYLFSSKFCFSFDQFYIRGTCLG